MSGAELSDGYLDQVAAVNASAALYKDLLYRPAARTC